MSPDAEVPFQSHDRDRSITPWLGRLRDRAEVAARDGSRLARERTAVMASVGRAQMERAERFVTFHAQRRPLMAMGLAIGAGLLIGAALASGAARNRT